MTKWKNAAVAAIAILCLGATGAAQAALAIVAHPSNALSGLSVDDAELLFLGKSTEFSNGRRAVPVEQAVGTAARMKFYKSVLKRSEDEVRAYWSKLMFSGRGEPPREFNDDAAVKAFVANNPDAIGYIDGKFVDSSVKVLLIVP